MWNCQLFRWTKSKGVVLSSWLALAMNTAMSQQPSQPIKWHTVAALVALQWDGGKRGGKSSVGPWKKKLTALCSEKKWLPVRDEPISSPHLHILVSVDSFSVMGAFAYFLHSDAVLHLQMIAFIWPAEESKPVVNYKNNRYVKQFTMRLSAYLQGTINKAVNK